MKKGLKLVVTGGAGYVASSLLQTDSLRDNLSSLVATSLSESLKDIWITDVILIDKLSTPTLPEYPSDINVQYIQVDLTEPSYLYEVLKGVDVVYHLASYGMSGREQLHKAAIWKVNVEGTRNVIKACLHNNVKALIFASTVNVVFGGQRIDGGDETLPYFPSEQRPWDDYGNSKMLADQSVLQANGSVGDDGTTTLRTCVLRLPGIYGYKERRHLPRVAALMKQGLFKVKYGKNPIVEFINVCNVTECLLLATRDLLQSQSLAAGEAYFISDGEPINNFEFFRPMTEVLNVPYPKVTLPMSLIFAIAFIIELVYKVLHPLYDFQPLLTRAEVYKTAQTHYFSIEKARKHLGYQPKNANDMKAIAEDYRVSPEVVVQGQSWTALFVNISLVFFITCIILSYLPIAG
ncbi:short-chain dehydrogenase/reductase family 42E member 1-like [Watersipora subatra]|uniref:short-chain dehydrogenase/reductase family 42E member 1-like n=1 Tax=Watersipora subatra TaxID=2589382 RepID=UPI00355AED00